MTTPRRDNPVLRSARREMIVTFALAAAALTWTVGYSYVYGYLDDPADVEFVGLEQALSQLPKRPETKTFPAPNLGLPAADGTAPAIVELRDKKTGKVVRTVGFVFGLPDWIVWGVVVPWLTCAAVSVTFGATFMRDEDLGQDLPEEGGDNA